MEIEKAFKKLLIRSPFYGLFCLSLPKKITKDIPTLCITKEGINCQLNINPDFWAQHTDNEQIALLEHELSHIAFQHMFMVNSFSNTKLFNIAADCEINSYIDNLPKGGITASKVSAMVGTPVGEGLGTKKYYELLENQMLQQKQQAQSPQQSCNGGKGGNGKPDDSQQQNSPSSLSPSLADESESQQEENPQEKEQLPSSAPQDKESQYPDEFKEFKDYDDHSTWKDFQNAPEATQQLMQNNINSIIKSTAEEVMKQRGTIPAEFTEIVEKLQKKKPEVFNWKAYFRRLLGSIYDVNIKSTRRKQSKRFEGAAGIQHKKKVSILVAIDTSGSVSTEELQEFFSELDYAYKAGARITIIQCDTVITDISEYDGKNLPDVKGRGGTDFNPPVEYYIKHRKEYASLIYFTDGEAPLPYKKPSGVVWVISSMGCQQDFPGKTIYIPKNNGAKI
jgi:predicted metal-dependent peptidase